MTITAVVFDFGGVLTQSSLGGIEDHGLALGLPAGALTCYFRNDSMMSRLEIGEIESREFFKYVCTSVQEAHGVRIDIRELARAAATGEVLNPAMIDVVAAVHQSSTTALLTNNVAGAGWRGTFPFEHFDHVIDSSAVGVRKPDPAIYRELLRVLDRSSEQVAFIDDYTENLQPAADLGICTLHFQSVEQCLAELGRLGVRIDDPALARSEHG